MAKDPAINWYFDNWSGGTKGFTRHQKGCYMDLLESQFYLGHLSLEQVKNILGSDFSVWGFLQSTTPPKFSTDENGNFFNERLELEKNKRMRYSESRKNNRNGKNNHMSNICSTHVPHMSNIPETETGIGNDFFGKPENLLPKHWPKPLTVERVFIQQGGTKEMAQAFFNKWAAVDWHNRGSLIKEFNFLVPNFIINWRKNNSMGKDFDSQKTASNTDDYLKALKKHGKD